MAIELQLKRANSQQTLYAQSEVKIKAKVGESYSIIDTDTGLAPTGLQTTRKGAHLIIKNEAGNTVLVIEDFWKTCSVGDSACQFTKTTAEGSTTITQSDAVLSDTASASSSQTGSLEAETLLSQKVTFWPYKGVDVGSSLVHASSTAAVLYALFWATQQGGNKNPSGPSGDTTPPPAPILFVRATGSAAGTVEAFGYAEPLSMVVIVFPNDETQTAQANSDGTFSVISQSKQPTGTLSATAKDAAGNVSNPGTAEYTNPPPTFPLIAVQDSGNGNGTVIVSGVSEPFANITVQLPTRAGAPGETLTTQASSTGLYTVTTSKNYGDGTVSVTANDGSNTPATGTQVYNDLVPAQAITLTRPSANVAYLVNSGNTITITGTGEPLASLSFKLPNTEVLNATIGENGTFSVTSTSSQPTGRVSATMTDLGANVVNLVLPDHKSVPFDPILQIYDSGLRNGTLTILGVTEAGATVNIRFPNQSERITNAETLTVVASALDGTFTVALDYSASFLLQTALAKGDTNIFVTATNEVGTSAVKTITYDDTVAPDPIKNLVLAGTRMPDTNPVLFTLSFVGTAEPWSTVTILAQGQSSTVNTNALGVFAGQLDNLTTGANVSVSWRVTDIGGNTTESITPQIVVPPDVVGPTVAVTGAPNNLNILDDSAFITFTFSEAAALTASLINVVGGSLTVLATGTSSVLLLFTATPNFEGVASISVPNGAVTDGGGNTNTDGSDANNTLLINVDTIAPSVALSVPDTTLTVGATTTIDLLFSEDIGTSLSLSDLVFSGGSIANLLQSTTNPLLWQVDFTVDEGTDQVWLVGLGSQTFSDSAGNVNSDGLDTNNTLFFSII